MPIRADMPSFSAGEIGPQLAARIDVAKYRVALRRARNVIGMPQGGQANRQGSQFVGEVRNSAAGVRLIPFQFSTEQAYVLEFSNLSMRVIKDGAYVLEDAKPVVAVPAKSPLTLTITGHGYAVGDQLYLDGLGGLLGTDGLSKVDGRTWKVSTSVDANTITLADLRGIPIDASTWTDWTAGGTVARVYTATAPYQSSELELVNYEQSADVMYLARTGRTPYKLSRTDHDAWTFTAVNFGSTAPVPQNVVVTANYPGGGTLREYRYLVTYIDPVTGQESPHSDSNFANNDLTVAGASNDITWDMIGVAGDGGRFVVYEEVNGIYGYVGGTTSNGFADRNITPDLGDTPPIQRDVFNAPTRTPATVTFHEQRLAWGGTAEKPNGIWMSQSGNFENMNTSIPAKADDSLTFAMVAQQVNAIRHMVSLNDLLVFTSDAIFKVNGGGVTGYMSPTSIVSRRAVKRGASSVRPIVIDDVVIYNQAKGAVLRTVNYTYESDGYKGNDLTVLAPHFFEGHTVVEMAWAEYPLSCIYVVRSDGKMLCLTWMLEEEVWGWTLLETDGLYESIAVITEDGEDAVYVVVNRSINGVQKRYVERFATSRWLKVQDAIFMDAAISFQSGTAKSHFDGLDHLAGMDVAVLADGCVVEGMTVVQGAITLPHAAHKVHVGLPYEAEIITLPPIINTNGSMVGRSVQLGEVVIKVMDTRGIDYGDGDGLEMYPVKYRDMEPVGDPPDMMQGDVTVKMPASWSTSAGVMIRQTKPLPMRILGVFPEVTIGG